jgi:hypothetical protein
MPGSEKRGGGGGDRPPRNVEHRPAPSEGEAIGLSIEERGMLLAPDVPVPTNQVNIGNMPAADARPATGGNEGGGSESSGQGGDGGSKE